MNIKNIKYFTLLRVTRVISYFYRQISIMKTDINSVGNNTF